MLTMEYDPPVLPVCEAATMAGLPGLARTTEVTAIHSTNLLGALQIYARFMRLKPPDEVAPRAVITAGDLQLTVEGGHVSTVDACLKFDEQCVRFTTPSVWDAFATLRRAGARVIDGVQVLGPDCAAFSLASRDGTIIEFIGRP